VISAQRCAGEPHQATGSRLADLVIASVGGQGGLLATRVLAGLFQAGGEDVKTSEVHGMAQRGGTVLSFVRRGRQVFSPLVEPGAADAILGLELLEAARALPFLRAGGVVVTSTERIAPMPVALGREPYPQDLEQRLRSGSGTVVLVPAARIAAEIGNPRVANVVCLGALSRFLEHDPQAWEETIASAVPSRTVELNLRAFRAGRELAAQ
jgi:indolepyruvate ferredoxin oxidoreductase beta subunit